MTDDIDLAAWEVPEPPEDLADSVIARLGGTDITPAIPVEEPTLRRRALLIGGVAIAALALAVGIWALIANTERVPSKETPIAVNPAVVPDAGAVSEQLTGVAPPTVTVAQAPSCDARALRDKGNDALAQGHHGEALGHYEAAYKCDADPVSARLAFVAACNVMNKAKAKLYYKKLSAADRTKYLPLCIRNNVDVDDATPTCDADKLKEEAIDLMGQRLYDGALTTLEAALACRDTAQLRTLAFASACNAKAAAKAKDLYKRLSVGEQKRLAPICIRNYIALDDCDANALKEQGLRARDPAKALALFEQSLACKHDATVVGFAYEMACSAGDQAKAKRHYDALTTKPKTICGSTCDAKDLKDQGMRAVNMGEHAKALGLFEQSLACKSESEVVALAFMSACNAGDKSKARMLYGQLTKTQQTKYSAICDRNGIDVSTSCDAEGFKDKGMEAVNNAQHANALSLFEASLACKRDPYVTSLAFLSACSASNAPKARALYAQLTAAQQGKYKVLCLRNGVDLNSADQGYLKVFSKPAAKILVDGKDTGLTTPIDGKQLALAPGKHKVTFVIGQERYTYQVTIVAGQTESLSKDLQ